MFLFPALVSGSCDIAVLYIHATIVHYESSLDDENRNEINSIEGTQYLSILSILRLLLLPLLTYHCISGLRIKYPFLCHFFYTISLLLVLIHLFYSIIHHDDDDTIPLHIPVDILYDIVFKDSSHHNVRNRFLKGKTVVMRRIFVMVMLSGVSIILHWVMLWHVRSTAPDNHLKNVKNKRSLAYVASTHFRWRLKEEENGDYNELIDIQDEESSDEDLNDDTPSSMDMDRLLLPPQNNRTAGSITEASLLIIDLPISGATKRKSKRQPRASNVSNHLHCFSTETYDELYREIQYRSKTAKQIWTVKLEEFTTRFQQQTQRSLSHLQHLQNSNYSLIFRTLLQLFAYEDVLSDESLDRAFGVDGGESLRNYVPQLLSFLLHGAYLNGEELELWVLEKCRVDMHFAHRCFWFLRGWCLDGSNVDFNFLGSPDGTATPRSKSEANLGNLLFPTLPENLNTDSKVPKSNSSNDLMMGRKNGKFHAEEFQMIEKLLLRVMECGEVSAKEVQFGSSCQNEDRVPQPEMTRDTCHVELGFRASTEFIPVDPDNGCPSVSHLNTVTATHTHGFLPLSPTAQNNDQSNLFLTTIHFLDKLIYIADDLLFLPREKRTQELQSRLGSVEVEFLPSNVCYLPIQNVHHRVWRIVTDESFAISTKERVPCIVTMEVIDYNQEHQQLTPDHKKKCHKKSERELLNDWYKLDRPAQRHNTIFGKVSHHTIRGLQKLKTEIEGNELWGRRNSGEYHDEESPVIPHLQQDCCSVTDMGGAAAVAPASPTTNGSTMLMTPKEDRGNMFATENENSGIPTTPCPSSPNLYMGQWSTTPTPALKRKSRISMLDSNGVDLIIPLDDDIIKEFSIPDITNGCSKSIDSSDEPPRSQLFSEYSPPAHNGLEIPSSVHAVNGSHNQQIPHQSSTSIPPVVFKEDWQTKSTRLRSQSAYGSHPGWRLLPILIKSNDDLRQEQLASQLIHRMAAILSRARVPVWLYPYEILALSDRAGIIEMIPDTISIDSLKRNDPNFTTLPNFFEEHFGPNKSDLYASAKANFVESLAAYSMVSFLLQIKDRHNGNILLDNKGHIIHIDFGFFFLSSPGKNSGFESAPFKLTTEFVGVMEGPNSRTFARFRDLCYRTFIELRKNCYQITLLVEMLTEGNEDLPCFRGTPEEAVRNLRERFRLDLSDRACAEYVNSLIDESLENWRTRWYDRYQRFCVGVL